MSEFVDSKSDGRTVNNVMRHEYRVLSDDEMKDAILFVVSMMLIFSVPIGLSLFAAIGRLLGAP